MMNEFDQRKHDRFSLILIIVSCLVLILCAVFALGFRKADCEVVRVNDGIAVVLENATGNYYEIFYNGVEDTKTSVDVWTCFTRETDDDFVIKLKIGGK